MPSKGAGDERLIPRASTTRAQGLPAAPDVFDGRDLAQLTLGDGLTIVTEQAFGAAGPRPTETRDDDRSRVARIRAAWSQLMTTGFSPEAATKLLAEHAADSADGSDAMAPLAGTCIHLDTLGYGTRSAMVLTVTADDEGRILWAEGPPCMTPFTEIDPGTGVPKRHETR